MIEWPTATGLIEAGDRIRDRKHPIETGTVLAVRDIPAEEYHVDAIETTVAADNADYPATDPVVELVWSERCDIDLSRAREEYTVYHFPSSRLVCEACVRDVSPSTLRPSPYHTRTFAVEENHNEGYIDAIRSQGYIESLLLARETTDGLELVAGHKRRWVAQRANLDTVAVRVVDLSAWEAAIHYAEDHLWSLDEEPARRTVRAFVERWGERAVSLPSVRKAIERVDLAADHAGRGDSPTRLPTARE